MKKRTWVTAVAAAGTLIFVGGGVANAASLNAFAVLGGTSGDANVFYTPGPTGGLTISNSAEFLQGKLGQGYDGNATATFTNMLNGAFVLNGNGTFDQILNPTGATSSFVITDNTTNNVLLSGTFGRADLTGTNGSSSGNVNLYTNNVTFTGGTFLPAGYSPNNGSLSIEFTAEEPFSATSTGLAAFNGVDGVTFSGTKAAAAVPEPASSASLAAGLLMLAAAVARKRRHSSIPQA